MNDENQSEIKVICKNLLDDFSGTLSWKWDDWVGTILAEFDSDRMDDVSTILSRYLPVSWDSSSIGTAPEIVQKLDKHLGGLRPTQLLFNSDPSGNAFVFSAWWPWGNGETISLRLAFFDATLSKEEDEALTEELKGWAGL